MTTALCGLGPLLCLPALLMRSRDQPDRFDRPSRPSLHFALDPLALFFLVIAFLAAIAVASVQAIPIQPATSMRATIFCIGGIVLALLAADGVTLTVGLAATVPRPDTTAPSCSSLSCSGRRLPVDAAWLRPALRHHRRGTDRPQPHGRCRRPDPRRGCRALLAARPKPLWSQNALAAGMLIPFGLYLLLRLTADLSVNATPSWWGFVLLLAGGTAALTHGWRATITPDINTATAALVRQQSGLAISTIGLALIARIADLPGAANFAPRSNLPHRDRRRRSAAPSPHCPPTSSAPAREPTASPASAA